MRQFYQIFTLVLATLSLQSFAGETVDKTLAQGDASTVNVENLRGKVKMIGWDEDIISVQGEVDEKAEELIFEKDGTDINIKVVMPHRLKGHWGEKGSDLIIKIPKQLKLSFVGVSTDVDVANFTKSVQVKTVSGQIEASSLQHYIELTSVSGDINSRDLSGKINLSTVSGDVKDRNSSGRLKMKAVSGTLNTKSSAEEVFANVVSGEIELFLSAVDDIHVSTVSGDIDGKLSLNDNGLLKMSSVSGDMDIEFLNNVQANFRMKSNASGDLVNRLTNDKAQHAKYGPSSKLYFKTGDGSASVKATTVSGSIKISGQ